MNADTFCKALIFMCVGMCLALVVGIPSATVVKAYVVCGVLVNLAFALGGRKPATSNKRDEE